MALEGMHPRIAGRSRPAQSYAWIAVAVGAIWVAVVLASIFAPPMVTGTQHDRMPIAALGDWVWGAIATGAVVTAGMDGIRAGVSARTAWMTLGIGVGVVWIAVLLVSVFAPDLVTGTDPTRLPFGAMLSPIAGLALTRVVCGFVKAAFQQRPMELRGRMQTGVRGGSPDFAPLTANDDAAARLRQLPELRSSGVITEEEFETKKRELLSRM